MSVYGLAGMGVGSIAAFLTQLACDRRMPSHTVLRWVLPGLVGMLAAGDIGAVEGLIRAMARLSAG